MNLKAENRKIKRQWEALSKLGVSAERAAVLMEVTAAEAVAQLAWALTRNDLRLVTPSENPDACHPQ